MTDALETNISQTTDLSANSEIRNHEPETTQDTTRKDFSNREDLIAYLTEIINKPTDAVKDEVDALKQLYYKLRKQEIETAKSAFEAENNPEAEFVAEPDRLENTLKDLLNEFKAKRLAANEERERIKEDNYRKKEEILNALQKIVDDPDNINKHYNDFIELQHQFREIKEIPTAKVNGIWKSFQTCTESFYDLLKINKELRDYDFKKNQEKKEALCDEAEALVKDNDAVGSFRKLQELHEEWRQTGPVAQNMREILWNRFKEASSAINKRHQHHFETIKEQENHNADAKIAICEAIESYDLDKLTSFAAWEAQTKKVIELQEDWKKLGFASKKINHQLFERFRKNCDLFFKKKADFYHQVKDDMNANLEKKRALCEKAESLKDSTDWKNTTDQMVSIQKEWKTIGPIPRKYSDSLWHRFIAACDYFFEQKEKANASTKSIETENLGAKNAIIEKLNALASSEEVDGKNKEVRELMNQWNAIGHVPFKEKDKIYKAYQSVLDVLFKKFNMHGSKVHLDSYAANINKLADSGKAQNSLYKEREKLMRTFDHIKNEVKTYENNMGFLSSSSKGGNALVKEMERKIEKLKEDMLMIAKKIDMIDEKLK